MNVSPSQVDDIPTSSTTQHQRSVNQFITPLGYTQDDISHFISTAGLHRDGPVPVLDNIRDAVSCDTGVACALYLHWDLDRSISKVRWTAPAKPPVPQRLEKVAFGLTELMLVSCPQGNDIIEVLTVCKYGHGLEGPRETRTFIAKIF